MGQVAQSVYRLSYGLDGPGIETRWKIDFPHPSRPALGPTHPPVQWVLGLSRGQSSRGVALTTNPHIACWCCLVGLHGRALYRHSTTSLVRTLVIRKSNYPDQLGPSYKFVGNSTKLTSLAITGFLIEYGTVLWLLKHQIRRGRKV